MALVARAFRHRNFRLFFAGQAISIVGTTVTRVATSWLVFRLTGSAWLLGLTAFVGQFPTFLVAPFAGVWIDRFDRRRVVIAMQALSMGQSGVLALLALGGWIDIPLILALSAVQGVIDAFDYPARDTLLVDLVEDKADLLNAVSLNSSMGTAARLVGPAIGGFLIAAFGEGLCFLIDSLSFLPVLGCLFAIRVAARPRAPKDRSVLASLADGFRYVANTPRLRAVLLFFGSATLLGAAVHVLLPVFAGAVLEGDSHTLGFLASASGLGALIGTLYLASRPSGAGLNRLVGFAMATAGGGLIVFSQSRWLWLSLFALVVAGFGSMMQISANKTLLTTLIDQEEKRGRVMSFFATAYFAAHTLGGFLAGLPGSGRAPWTILVSGVGLLVAAGLFLSRSSLRRAPVERA